MLSSAAISEVRQYEPFNQLSEELLRSLSASIRRVSFDTHQRVCLQGEEAVSFYLLVGGRVTLSRISAEGQEKIFDILEPGEVISETALFLDSPEHLATVKAITPCTLYSFKCAPMKLHLAENPQCCLQFLNAISKKFVDSMLEIESLTMDTAISRVAGYLVKTSQKAGTPVKSITLPAQKQLLASRLGITPETLSRIFNKFRKEKLISIDGLDVKIPDVSAIQNRYVVGANIRIAC